MKIKHLSNEELQSVCGGRKIKQSHFRQIIEGIFSSLFILK
jgi:hypothetical protein